MKKFLSRKFLLTVAGIVIDICIGLNMNVDPEVITAIAGAIASVYIIIEGVIDAVKK